MKSIGLGCLLASTLAGTALGQGFQGFQGFGGGNLGGGGASRAAQGSVGQPLGGADISFDPETRRLIVVTDDKTVEDIRKVVIGLDRPSPDRKSTRLNSSHT